MCPYWSFHHGLRFQICICNDCHNSLIMRRNISNINIFTFKGADYSCKSFKVSKPDAIYLLENSMLNDREFI